MFNFAENVERERERERQSTTSASAKPAEQIQFCCATWPTGADSFCSLSKKWMEILCQAEVAASKCVKQGDNFQKKSPNSSEKKPPRMRVHSIAPPSSVVCNSINGNIMIIIMCKA